MRSQSKLPVVLAAALLGIAPAFCAGAAMGAFPESLVAILSAEVPDDITAIAVGDFNGDGIADVVETRPVAGENSRIRSLTVLLGKADGTFRRVVSRNLIGADPRALVVGDFNGDGKLDVVVGDGDGSLVEFFGDGKGNLIRSRTIAMVGSVASIAAGHFTHDGRLDLAVSDFNSNTALIFLGAGDGTFKETWSFALPQQGKSFTLRRRISTRMACQTWLSPARKKATTWSCLAMATARSRMRPN